ncbi:MAG TPA: T9SS type A sorting domain-containing protein [Saprospiraceae bacterium]|nr:T9SS type A sorting domain-containing protein [Saprospiraceae bacterium]
MDSVLILSQIMNRDVVKNLKEDINFSIFNVGGLIVKRGQLGSVQNIPTSDLADGVYCIILRDLKGNIMETRKLVKLK